MEEGKQKIDFEKLKDPIYFILHMMEAPKIELASYHRRWIRMAEKNSRLAIQAPRGHGKSEVLLISYSIYKAFSKPRSEILIISKSLPQSTDILRRIKSQLKGSPLLASSVPDERDSVWSKTEIELTNGSRILCKPYSDSVRGFHVDLVCCDEVGTYDEKDTFWFAVTPTVNKKKGSIICIGTPKTKIDLLNDLCKNPQYANAKYTAIMNGKPLWPSSFPMRKLNEIKEEIGTLAFSQEYMCDPLSAENQIFPYGLISKGFKESASFKYEGNKDKYYFFGLW